MPYKTSHKAEDKCILAIVNIAICIRASGMQNEVNKRKQSSHTLKSQSSFGKYSETGKALLSHDIVI